MLGAGGGTSSYKEIETTDLIILWGSNARNAHPIFFHHLAKGVRNGAKMYTIDPRRSESAEWADTWLGIDVGSDIALSNTVAREIITAGLVNTEFIEHSTSGFATYAESVESWTLERGEEITGVPADAIRSFAHDYAKARTAQLCWTLGITEHANATDNVLSLINLSLLTGHVGRWGSGLVPIRGQNNVQGGGDMGALPNKFPGFQDVTDPDARAKFEATWETSVPVEPGWHISQMIDAMESGDLTALYVIGENPAQSEADVGRTRKLLEGLDHLVVQDMFLTKTAKMADVVFPAAAGWAETDGTVTSSERRVQRVRKALDPPGDSKDDIEILTMLAGKLGHDWELQSAEAIWDELRSLSPMHAGMSYDRLEALGGLQWPCPDENHPGTPFLHAWLWEDPMPREPAPFSVVRWVPPVDPLADDFPIRLTTGRRLDSYNTGVQSSGYRSPIRADAVLDMTKEQAADLDVAEGQTVKVTSRRGSIEVRVRIVKGLRRGLVFMAFHAPDEVDVNRLTIDAWDPKSGTAEFKATAVRIDKIPEG
ncbi:MAG: molybdopterin-dependent oxidoreductase [Acidimicrobiia bacterium]|nr:MAG: molybdopterin-dependent oxidoreductase [Acidimicrobiia bacterium]